MTDILASMIEEIIASSDEKTRIQGEKFFRESVRIHGLRSMQTELIGKKYYKLLPDTSARNVFRLCGELWKTNYMEECLIACMWSYNARKQFSRDDFYLFEEWVNIYITNWATCDTLCNHTVGTMIEMYPELIENLKRWSRSENRWVKRASAVSLIIPARKGLFLKDIFEIASIMHSDKDDMVQKGYGWMLKAASQAHQKEVFDYVLKNKATMPRTSLRYAIEKMPAELKALAMAK
jgi:3-methyladenine DNA glycosylase AlkD